MSCGHFLEEFMRHLLYYVLKHASSISSSLHIVSFLAECFMYTFNHVCPLILKDYRYVQKLKANQIKYFNICLLGFHS